jgi:tyrosyl-tRNA synthetase
MTTTPDTAPQSAFLNDMQARGYIYQVTDMAGLDARAKALTTTPGALSAYVGYDATADSLHVGHMVSIMMLRRLQQAGGRPIVLMGGGTTKIGDPTDKEKSRPMLTEAEIAANIASIRTCFTRFLRFDDTPNEAIMVNNADWLDKIGYIDFLREYGRHFTVNVMVKQDTVARRLAAEQPYTFLEFNYALLQAYDFLELNRREGCALQMGGSDQWGNILNGVDLCRKIEGSQVFGLTTPLMTTASGQKMGKTVGGAVWLNPDKLSPFDYWQFWRNTEDADVGRFLRLFTDYSLTEIAELEALPGARINEAKVALADACTTLLHGEEEATKARAAAASVFAGGGSTEGLPTFEVTADELAGGLSLAAAFERAEMVASRGEARRLIQGGGLKLNGETLTDPNATLTEAHFGTDATARLSVGKKKHALLKRV